jgi:Type II secretion system (T2SS), protein M subtype b
VTTPAENRSIPFLLLPSLLLTFVLVLGGISLFHMWKQGSESVEEQLAAYDKVRAIAAFKTVLPQSVSSSDQGSGMELFYADGTPAIVAAQLLTNVKQMAVNHGLEVLRFGDVPVKVESPLTLVGGSFDLSGPIANVYALIHDIENAKPALFIDTLDLHGNGAPDGSNEQNADTILTVTMQIFGAMHTNAAIAK